MNRKHVSKMGRYIGMACLLFVCATVQSCRDEYYYDDREPDFLGSSIYDYLQEQGNFKHFLKVIDDLDYDEVLRKTGSKTLFVADDEAFMKGIYEEWNIKDVAKLTVAQKKIILYSAMLDNAYLLEMLSKMQSTGINAEPVSGKSIRRSTSASVVDTIGLFDYSALPKNNPDWNIFNPNSDKFSYAKVRLALDATEPLMLYFTQDYMYQNSITESDLQWMVGNQDASWSDIYVFDKKVLKDKSDIICKNGYVHQLDGLLIPPSNMAEVLRLNGDKNMLESGALDWTALADNDSTTMLFSRMLDRFSVPVPIDEGSEIAESFHRNKQDEVVEQLYEKRYYTAGTDRGTASTNGFTSYNDVDKMPHKALGSLLFDPGWNAYSGSSKEIDMAAIFAPSDKAVISFFKDDDVGRNLINRYGKLVPDPFGSGLVQAIDSIDVEVLQALVRNHMQMSFIGAVPSKFKLVMNDARDELGLESGDISHTMLANNGVVYVMKKLYSPARYESVIAPVMLDDTLSVFYKLIDDNDYDHYLLSMGNRFSLIATADTSMVYYSPETDVKEANKREAYCFETSRDKNNGNLIVEVKVYEYENKSYDPTTNTYTLSKTAKTKTLNSDNNLMKEIMEYNIVVGDMNSEEDCNSGKKYYMAKGYGTVMVKRGMAGKGKVTAIAGGRERQNGTWIPVGEEDAVEMVNGHTFKLRTSMIQPPTQSVYKVFEQTPEFQRFFDLCQVDPDIMRMVYGTDEEKWKKYRIFDTSDQHPVRRFDSYHYTIYVPDSSSLDNAFKNEGLPSWESLRKEYEAINQLSASESARRKVMVDSLKAGVELLLKFVNYHFQDNSVYADMPPHAIKIDGQDNLEYEADYETSALNDSTNRYCTLNVKSEERNGKQTLAVRGDFPVSENYDNACYVVNTESEKENILYNVMAREITFQNSWDIYTSSYVVMHQIDGCLKFGGKGGIYDAKKGMFVR